MSQTGDMIDREEAAPLIPGSEQNAAPAAGEASGGLKTVAGQVFWGNRLVGYTAEGARSATEGGVIDPTVQEGTGTVTDPMPGTEPEPEP